MLFSIVMGVIVGVITFFGSIAACLKLQVKWNLSRSTDFPQGTISSKPVLLPFRHAWNLLMFLGVIALSVLIMLATDDLTPGRNGTLDSDLGLWLLIGLAVLSSVLGIHWVLAIGGADMPVVISALNSFSGWATAFTGSNGVVVSSHMSRICCNESHFGHKWGHYWCQWCNFVLCNVQGDE